MTDKPRLISYYKTNLNVIYKNINKHKQKCILTILICLRLNCFVYVDFA